MQRGWTRAERPALPAASAPGLLFPPARELPALALPRGWPRCWPCARGWESPAVDRLPRTSAVDSRRPWPPLLGTVLLRPGRVRLAGVHAGAPLRDFAHWASILLVRRPRLATGRPAPEPPARPAAGPGLPPWLQRGSWGRWRRPSATLAPPSPELSLVRPHVPLSASWPGSPSASVAPHLCHTTACQSRARPVLLGPGFCWAGPPLALPAVLPRSPPAPEAH